ncbi:MAG TPA: M28 family peptidase [Gemmatimonadales bacterium]|nr:M28 family peptidase [Gemmatimonadales bacterium]
MRHRAYAAALLASTVLAACHQSPPPREFDGQQAFGYLQQEVAFGYRIPGTPGHAREAAWLDSLLRLRADSLVVQSWKHVTARKDTLQLTNFIARFNLRAPERVLFLAHWDTRPVSDNASYKGPRTPVPGANDGASGVAVLLGMADALKKTPPAVGVDLLFVDGEDYGDFNTEKDDVLIGSRYYAQHLVPGPTPLYAVLFDMVGDKDLRILPENQSLLGAPEVVNLVWTVAREIGHGGTFVDVPGSGPTLIDDHAELQKVGIRAIDVVDFDYGPGNSYWHTPADTIDKVSAASLQIVGDVGMALIRKR